MATANYQMQALKPDGTLQTWVSAAPDWTAALAPVLGSGSYTDIVVAGGGFDIGDTTPDNAMIFDDGSFVVFDDGSFAVTT